MSLSDTLMKIKKQFLDKLGTVQINEFQATSQTARTKNDSNGRYFPDYKCKFHTNNKI